MPNSTNLALPFIDANQNQKHVTHNSALRILDALVQIQVQSASLTTPPASPGDGQCWIAASGATGAWTGKDLNLACWQDGAWVFYPPRPGYEAFNVATGQLLIWTGSAWVPIVLPTTSNVVQLLPGGFVNKFRNGTMDVWQRGTSGTATTAAGPSTQTAADGWYVVPSGASVTWAQQGGRQSTKSSLQITGAAGVTDVLVKQRVESLIAAALAGQTVTVQAQVYNNTGAAITPTLTVNRPSAQDNYSSVAADVSAASLQGCASGVWTRVAYTFNANAASYYGLEISIDFGNNFSTTGKSIQLTELDIRVTPGVTGGLIAATPPPEMRPVSTELLVCQRYFNKSYLQGTTPGATGGAPSPIFAAPDATTSYLSFGWLAFASVMRATPTVTIYNPNTGSTAAASNGRNFVAAADLPIVLASLGDSGFAAQVNGASVASGQGCGFHFTATAEL